MKSRAIVQPVPRAYLHEASYKLTAQGEQTIAEKLYLQTNGRQDLAIKQEFLKALHPREPLVQRPIVSELDESRVTSLIRARSLCLRAPRQASGPA